MQTPRILTNPATTRRAATWLKCYPNVTSQRLTSIITTLLIAEIATYFGMHSAVAQNHVAVEPGGTVVNVPVGGMATIKFRAFCLNRDLVFPLEVSRIGGRTSNVDLLKTLAAAIDLGYAQSQEIDRVITTQGAIWTITDTYDFDPELRELQETLHQHATRVFVRRLLDDDHIVQIDKALKDGLVTTTNTWDYAQNFVDENGNAVIGSAAGAVGEGTITLMNQTNEELCIYWPMGTVLPGGADEDQN